MTLDLSAKDLRLIVAAAEGLGLDASVAKTVSARVAAACAAGYADQDMAALSQLSGAGVLTLRPGSTGQGPTRVRGSHGAAGDGMAAGRRLGRVGLLATGGPAGLRIRAGPGTEAWVGY